MKNQDVSYVFSEEELMDILSDNSSEMSDIPKKKPLPQKPWWIDQPELAPDLRPDSDPMGTRTLHKSTNMADDAAIEWMKNQQSRFGKIKNLVKSVTPVAKQVGKKVIGAGLGAAGLLIQEGLGAESGSDDAIIEDPAQPLEIRKAAMMRMKNKYLKPQEENE
jgi:hypothetical protein